MKLPIAKHNRNANDDDEILERILLPDIYEFVFNESDFL